MVQVILKNEEYTVESLNIEKVAGVNQLAVSELVKQNVEQLKKWDIKKHLI